MNFRIENSDIDSQARSGLIDTDHGIIQTPIFMPVGTAATVKAVHQAELVNDINADIILGNTYHLYLRPGMEVMRAAGGLHQFMSWDRPILTDSGGYQVFSLAANRKLKSEGAYFSSHIDGSKHLFTPENVVDIQRDIGADFIMAFDECTPYPCDPKYARDSMHLTHSWLTRGIQYFNNTESKYGHSQCFIPIVQGSVYPDLRKESAEFIAAQGMDANAIGGLSVGEPVEDMYAMLEIVNGILPIEKPRYLMGVGTPVNILEGIARGVDMFDCVMPTRNGRNGMLFTQKGIMNMRNEKWKSDFSILDPDGTSFVDKAYSKGYLRHLIVSGERLGAQIASIHNLAFYLWLVREARDQINAGSYTSWKNRMVKVLASRL